MQTDCEGAVEIFGCLQLSTDFVDTKNAQTPLNKGNLSKKIERETGIEPATPTLARWCSTAEPLAHAFFRTMDTIQDLKPIVKNFF